MIELLNKIYIENPTADNATKLYDAIYYKSKSYKLSLQI